MAYQLLVGFDQSTPEADAIAAAVAEWREAVARDGWTAPADPVTRIVHSAARTAVGEFAVEVTGLRERPDGSADPAEFATVSGTWTKPTDVGVGDGDV